MQPRPMQQGAPQSRVAADLALALALGAMALLLPDALLAQPALPRPPPPSLPFEPLERPGEIRPELPPPGPPEEPGFVLPPLPVPGAEDKRLSGGPQIIVREFRVTGSS